MSKARRALLQKLLDKQKRGRVVYVPFPQWAWPPLDTLAPGEARKIPLDWADGGAVFGGRSECGTQTYVTLPPVCSGRRVREAEIIEHVREVLAERVVEAAEAAARPKHPKTNPKPLGRVSRTLAVREAVRGAQATASTVPTRLSKCPRCGTKCEVPVEGEALCPHCSTGGL